MLKRAIQPVLEKSLTSFPVVGLVGPRQAGKTTLAQALARNTRNNFVFLDLEKPSDLAKLEDPELYLRNFADRLVILDEIQRKPNLFPVLRALVDEFRRNGRFLILGSASPDLLRQSSESLAGRIIYHELSPFTLSEVGFGPVKMKKLWIRGGFPLSFLAKSGDQSFQWREAFLSTFLERDIPQLGFRVPSVTLHRFWKMLAHYHGGLWNGSAIAGSLGVSPPSARHYLDLLNDTYMIRQLHPYFANLGKRLVKSPKV
ncbi:ATP-binding protein, partial [bacterium]|nr:ATP-binding protein [bacterium]